MDTKEFVAKWLFRHKADGLDENALEFKYFLNLFMDLCDNYRKLFYGQINAIINDDKLTDGGVVEKIAQLTEYDKWRKSNP